MNQSFLVVDDDTTFNAVLVRALKRRGFVAQGATSPDAALEAAAELRPSCVVLDLNLGGSSSLGLIAPLLALGADTRIVVLTGYASIATAVDAVKLGALQYLAKPVDVDTLLAAFDPADPDLDADLPSSPLSVDRLEWEHIQRVLHENDGNISATARALQMHRRTLQRKLGRGPG